MQKKNIIRPVVGTAVLLMVPFIAMQFSGEMAWSPFDFLVAGVLLLGAGFAFELATSRAGSPVQRLAAGLAIGTALLLLWVNLAVGIMGSEDNPANLLFLGVLVVGMAGAGLARTQPRGMARAMFATAVAQALAPVFAMVIWNPPFTAGLWKALAGNAGFIAMWVTAGLLFRQADDAGSRLSRPSE